ncbi:DnaT-like ssDNA-binding protein [Humisphaera borealis]|uniref:Putative DnaT-like domain-containing protein n=1 Tax=Humisphaera borealis TaxID=2807512 RepID=A0A7M2WPS7_9BACT|nr:DnaT-like ssDNA-binding protein [Humisphaera borealis]QOV87409.1 hypothetical protein IPV69_14025 [Humisphaera borealis]
MPEPVIPAAAYLSLADADTLADALPELAAYKAVTDDEKSAALLQATIDIDSAMSYQGRRYDADQPREFPRSFDSDPAVTPSRVWDWDDDTQSAVVPASVKRAALYQADAILAGDRELRLSAQHDGVVYEQTGALAESYKSTSGPGVRSGLCRRAWIVLRRYRLQSGRLL